MISHRDAMKLNLSTPFFSFGIVRFQYTDQCEVGCATSYVTDKNILARAYPIFPVFCMCVNPCVKCRLRLFDQHDAFQIRSTCGFDWRGALRRSSLDVG